jgi:hypothetical protein
MSAIEIVQRANKAYNAHDADALAVAYAHDGAGHGHANQIVPVRAFPRLLLGQVLGPVW